jgi:hypothetical protein
MEKKTDTDTDTDTETETKTIQYENPTEKNRKGGRGEKL